MKREQFTYGQLNRALSSLDVTRRLLKDDPEANVYEHPERGLITILPALPESDRVYSHHFAALRFLLDQFGIADPTVFAAELKKAG